MSVLSDWLGDWLVRLIVLVNSKVLGKDELLYNVKSELPGSTS